MVSREELHQLVWAKPMTKVAEQFDVSSSYLARICTMLNVPRPEQGYWAKLAVGKAPPVTPLPEARPGDPLQWTRDGEAAPVARPKRAPRQKRETKVRIPRARTHRLIAGSKTHFEKSRKADESAHLKPYKYLLPDLIVSQACLDKALEFANDLFNAFESVGHRVVIAPQSENLSRGTIDEREDRKKKRNGYYYSNLWTPWRPTVVYIGSIPIGLTIIEMTEEMLLRYVGGRYVREADYVPPKPSRYRVDHTWTTTRDMPSGRLRLRAYSPFHQVDWSTEWQDTKRASIRSSIRTIVKSVEEAAAALVPMLEEAERQEEIRRREWEEAEERRRREEDQRRIEQSVRDSREQLDQIIQQWSHVVAVERFLSGVEERAPGLPQGEQAPVMERLKLARELLGSQDPFDFFLSWRSPGERYLPKYDQD